MCFCSSCCKCQKKYNKILHFQRQQPTSDTSEIATTSSNFSIHTKSAQMLLSTAIIKIEYTNGKKHSCRALLDSASECNIILWSLAQILRLPQDAIYLKVFGVNYISRTARNQCTAKLYYIFYISKQIILGANLPIIQKTRFGWVVSSSIGKVTHKNTLSTYFMSNASIEDKLEKFWLIEALPTTKPLPQEEIECEHFVETVKGNEDGRFIVTNPCKHFFDKIGQKQPWTKTADCIESGHMMKITKYNSQQKYYKYIMGSKKKKVLQPISGLFLMSLQ